MAARPTALEALKSHIPRQLTVNTWVKIQGLHQHWKEPRSQISAETRKNLHSSHNTGNITNISVIATLKTIKPPEPCTTVGTHCTTHIRDVLITLHDTACSTWLGNNMSTSLMYSQWPHQTGLSCMVTYCTMFAISHLLCSFLSP
jgi:hypothetical protein